MSSTAHSMATKHSAEIRLQMVKSLTGALYFLEGNVPFSPLRCEMRAGRRPTDRAIKRVSTRQKERERETEDDSGRIGLALLL